MRRAKKSKSADRLTDSAAGAKTAPEKAVLITGGAGFIGTNVAAHYAAQGQRVLIFDNLARAGAERNLRWLKSEFGSLIEAWTASVLDQEALRQAVSKADQIFHFAAQVAVTTSLESPQDDFEVNARGTLNVLEACRTLSRRVPLLFTSTNKVYGNLDDIPLRCVDQQYQPVSGSAWQQGISEQRTLNFHSPYGCSKGVADQYVLDYARCYNLPTIVFRMSCIYGPHQHGNEDQGWVAHFVRSALEGTPIKIFGDGYQVRDLLFVEDLVRAMHTAVEHIASTRGRAFNMGGGPQFAASVRQVIQRLASLHGTSPEVIFGDWRAGDQRYYTSDTSHFRSLTGWQPTVRPTIGLQRLYAWMTEHYRQESRRPATSFVDQCSFADSISRDSLAAPSIQVAR